MTQVFLTTADTSPWSVPGDFTASGHTVEIVGPGGNGAVGTTGASGNGGGGGGGGAYEKLTYSSGTVGSTIPFLVGAGGANNTVDATRWEGDGGASANYYCCGGGANASTTTGGGGGAKSAVNGTPTITYSITAGSSGGGSGGSAGKNLGGGGGGGAANLGGNGGNGFTANTTAGGGGGGSAGTSGAGGNSSGTAGGTAGSGGGATGGTGAAAGKGSTGGAGNAGTAFDATHGSGSGGGGSGADTVNETTTLTGGDGALYGGGGGGCGYARGTGSSFVAGSGKAGLICITYTPAVVFTPSANKFRFYNDGTESGSTPIANEDTNITLTVDQSNVQFHLRYRIQETAGASGAATDDYNIQYSVNGGSYANVTTSTAKVQVDTASSLTDSGATTNRATNGITDGTGSFVASQQEEGDGQITNFQLTASNFTEAVWAMKAISADVADTMTIDFRISLNGGTPGMTNSVTPRITIGKTAFTADKYLPAMGVGR